MMIVANANHHAIKSVGTLGGHTWQGFHDEVEQRLGPGGDLEAVRAWASRVRQSTGRIAGILHVARHAGRYVEGSFDEALDEETITRAVTLGRWIIDHGRTLVRPSEERQSRDDDRVLGYIRSRYGTQPFRAREVYRQMGVPATEVQAVLDRLVRQGRLAWSEAHQGRDYRLLTPDTRQVEDPP